MFVLLLMLSAMLETASITKRSYSDQSVRGYITEVGIRLKILSKITSFCSIVTEIDKTCYRGHVGGTKYAKKNSKYCSGVNVHHGRTAVALDDITTPSVP